MITENYVSFETAKLLKEKEFDSICNGYYNQEKVLQRASLCSVEDTLNSPFCYNCIPAPTIQMAMKWLREVHDIYIEINLSFSDNPQKYPPLYYVYVLDTKSGNSLIEKAKRIDGLNPIVNTINQPKSFETYEQACEIAINYCLENLI